MLYANIYSKQNKTGDFLEIAALRRILLSGVSVTRHVLGLVHPVSIFTTKTFDGIFWYERHSAGVHQYDFKYLIDVREYILFGYHLICFILYDCVLSVLYHPRIPPETIFCHEQI